MFGQSNVRIVAFFYSLFLTLPVAADGHDADRAAVHSESLQWQRRDAELDLFKAIAAGEVSVQAVPKDPHCVQLAVTNTSLKPLSVRLPAAMALVRSDARGLGTGGAASEPVFAVSGQSPSASSDFELPRPSVERLGRLLVIDRAGTVREYLPALRLDTQCWPRSGIRFGVVSADALPRSRAIGELLDQLAQSRCTPTVAQLAAWNLIGAHPWAELGRQTVVRGDGTIEPRFGTGEIQQARRLVQAASNVGDRPAASVALSSPTQRSSTPGLAARPARSDTKSVKLARLNSP